MTFDRRLVGVNVTLAIVAIAFVRQVVDQGNLAAVAAQATPAPADPAGCTVESRPFTDFVAVAAATPDIMQASLQGLPIATPVPPPVDAGTPADARVVEAVTTTAEQLAACLNAGDASRVFALYTDEAFALVLGGGGSVDGQTQPDDARFLTPTPLPPALRQPAPTVSDVRVLPNGRVSAMFHSPPNTFRVVLEEAEGRYRIAWSYLLSPAATPTP